MTIDNGIDVEAIAKPLADVRGEARAGILCPGILVAAEEEDVLAIVKDLGHAVTVLHPTAQCWTKFGNVEKPESAI